MYKEKYKEYRNLELINMPHVVILGAGASLAASPNGDKNNKKLPLMNELSEILNLNDILDNNEIIKAKENFELFYDTLVVDNLSDKYIEIENRLYNYFDTLELSNELTLYDKMLFSLRKKDLIATFNWDPLIGYAYRRNGYLKTLPHLVFLHGNVLQGVCMNDKILGWKDGVCNNCRKPLERTKLLYPVTNKDYDIDEIINEQWKLLDFYISSSYFITIFGYSAPYTDHNARERIIKRIEENKNQRFLQIEIIDPNAKYLSENSFKDILVDTHYSLLDEFNQSWLTMHPRFSCEALFHATMQQNPITPIKFPNNEELTDYRNWMENLNEEFPEFLNEGYENQG
jgi:hypothetical protein